MKNKLLITALLFLVALVAMITVIKGKPSTNAPFSLQYQYDKIRDITGPFEATNSTSRYALTEAIVRETTLFFNEDRAAFSTPDLAAFNGKYFTIFTPGISFIGVPFFILGDIFQAPQIGAYSINIIFALVNVYLIALIARKLGAGYYASLLAGFIFLFATNALSYALFYTQHHASTSIILLSLHNVLFERNLRNNLLLGVFIGIGLILDIPNLFLTFPIVLFVLFRHFKLVLDAKKVQLKINTKLISLALGFFIMCAVFGMYNTALTNSPLTIAQLLNRTEYNLSAEKQAMLDYAIKHQTNNVYEKKLSFDTRKQLDGIYVLLFSDERSWIYYSPVVLLGILGLIFVYKKNEGMQSFIRLIICIILLNIILYSMFGDPWGGWSFGSRYLIPSTALLCIGIPFTIDRLKKNYIFVALFSVLLFYSLLVNSLGAFTTSSIPPKPEAEKLETPIPHNYQYNINLAHANQSSSLIYNVFLKKDIDLMNFIFFYTTALYFFSVLIYYQALNHDSTK